MAASAKNIHRYPIPAIGADNPWCTQDVIRRSRFLAQGCHCASREAAINFLEKIRAVNSDATHNCWAYAAGPPGDTASIGSSDDGEPHGTAGRPMLNALLHSGIGQVCVVVSRYFGGVKLGTGGLARAYQDAVLKNVADMPLAESICRSQWRIVCPYSHLAAIKRSLERLEAGIISEAYSADAELLVSVPENYNADLCLNVANASSGTATVSKAADDTDI